MDATIHDAKREFAMKLLETSNKYEHELEKHMLEQSDRMLQIVTIIVAIAAIACSNEALKLVNKWVLLFAVLSILLCALTASVLQFITVKNPHPDPNSIIKITDEKEINIQDENYKSALSAASLLFEYNELKKKNKFRKTLLQISRGFLISSIILIGVISIALAYS